MLRVQGDGSAQGCSPGEEGSCLRLIDVVSLSSRLESNKEEEQEVQGGGSAPGCSPGETCGEGQTRQRLLSSPPETLPPDAPPAARVVRL